MVKNNIKHMSCRSIYLCSVYLNYAKFTSGLDICFLFHILVKLDYYTVCPFSSKIILFSPNNKYCLSNRPNCYPDYKSEQ